MHGTAGDPGDALMPGGPHNRKDTSSSAAGPDAGAHSPSSGSGESEPSEPEAPEVPEAPDTRKQTAERPGGEGAAGTASGIGAARTSGTPEPSTEESAEAASTAPAEAGAASATPPPSSAFPDPAAGPAPSRTVGGSPAVAAAAGDGDGDGPGTHADAEPPSGRLKKPMLAAAAIAGAVLISVPFLVAGQNDRKPEKEQTQNAAGTVLAGDRPVVPETYTSESPKPSVTPSEKEKKEKKKEPVRPSATPTLKQAIKPPPPPKTPVTRPTATVTAKAPAGTAASAMAGLARNDPHGRHICYRAFVAGHGWQEPVCDGTMTGTTDQGKKITALNIAVWNVEGSSANALLHDPGSTSGNAKWYPHWTDIIADGKNNYIGSSKKGAPFMTGFAMNIGNGSVCHTAKMGGGGWGPQICKNKRPEYMFVGTTGNDHWFEAVKLTV